MKCTFSSFLTNTIWMIEWFNYIIKWAHGDTKTIIELGDKIQKSAKKFIESLEKFEMQDIELAA